MRVDESCKTATFSSETSSTDTDSELVNNHSQENSVFINFKKFTNFVSNEIRS